MEGTGTLSKDNNHTKKCQFWLACKIKNPEREGEREREQRRARPGFGCKIFFHHARFLKTTQDSLISYIQDIIARFILQKPCKILKETCTFLQAVSVWDIYIYIYV